MGSTTRPGNVFTHLEPVLEHMLWAASIVGRDAAETFTDSTARRIQDLYFDSPLEVMFWIWWEAIKPRYQWTQEEFPLVDHNTVIVDGETFVLDFAVTASPSYTEYLRTHGHTWPSIAVEVDGHAFHERTLEQVALRDRRDRLLQRAGWKVFHFSYSEFTREPETCVEEVWEYTAHAYHQFYKDIARATCPPLETIPNDAPIL